VRHIIAKTIEKAAIGIVEKTVGRSYPWGMYEVEVPDEVKEYIIMQQKKREKGNEEK